jgi:histidinol dehydrogenase
MRIVDITQESIQDVLENLLKRSPGQYMEYEAKVKTVVNRVKQAGDEALFAYTEEFDHFTLTADNLLVTKEEIEEAYQALDPELVAVIRKAAGNIRSFHEKQLRSSWFSAKEDGTILGMKITPIDRVGVYVPGGTAAYPSSVLMNVIPAKTAGVPEVIMMTPPGSGGMNCINPAILAAADIAGVDRIYRGGGAQAIAAMAFGTRSIPKVNKITGPGNIYVTLAKKAVYGYVGIDSIAGPSEILVLADETATPAYVAADLLSQAEHDPLASAILITTSPELAKKVSELVMEMTNKLSRKEIIQKSLDNYGYILLAKDMATALEAVNEIASEHVEVLTQNPFETMTHIRNAGAIFLGEYSCEPLGDYYAGPNHILPTNGTAKFFSPVNVDDYVKKSSIISYSKEALSAVHTDIERFAESEGLTAHAGSIRVRFEEN